MTTSMNYSLPTLIKTSVITLFVIALLGYGMFEARHLIRGPILTITEPEDGAVVTNNELIISGNAANISFITLNNRDIFTDENGDFKEKLLLQPGYSIIEVQVTDRFGRQSSLTRKVVYDAPRTTFDPSTYTLPTTTASTTASTTPEVIELEE